jgi:hypothetical protein
MQHRRPRARAIAILAAGAMLLAGLLAMRHETMVAHVRDHATGAVHHAHELAEHHAQELDGTPAHVHRSETPAHEESGGCALHQGLESSTILASAPHVVALQQASLSAALETVTPVAEAVYRLAPKTSPPAHALA